MSPSCLPGIVGQRSGCTLIPKRHHMMHCRHVADSLIREFFMRKSLSSFLAVVLLIALVFTSSSFAQECGMCPQGYLFYPPTGQCVDPALANYAVGLAPTGIPFWGEAYIAAYPYLVLGVFGAALFYWWCSRNPGCSAANVVDKVDEFLRYMGKCKAIPSSCPELPPLPDGGPTP